jgi:hypothetical protein
VIQESISGEHRRLADRSSTQPDSRAAACTRFRHHITLYPACQVSVSVAFSFELTGRLIWYLEFLTGQEAFTQEDDKDDKHYDSRGLLNDGVLSLSANLELFIQGWRTHHLFGASAAPIAAYPSTKG